MSRGLSAPYGFHIVAALEKFPNDVRYCLTMLIFDGCGQCRKPCRACAGRRRTRQCLRVSMKERSKSGTSVRTREFLSCVISVISYHFSLCSPVSYLHMLHASEQDLRRNGCRDINSKTYPVLHGTTWPSQSCRVSQVMV